MFPGVKWQYLLLIFFIFVLFPFSLLAKKGRLPVIVDRVHTYAERNGLKIGHFDSDIYIKFRMENDRRNIAMRLIPFMGKMEEGKKSYLGECSFRLAYTAPGIIDKKEEAFYSTMPYMRNLRDMIIANINFSVYEPTLFRDRILSPLNWRNKNYYRYGVDTLVQFEGRWLQKVNIRPRFNNTQLVKGYMYVVPATGEVRLFNFSFSYNAQHISGTVIMGDKGLSTLLPKDVFLRFDFIFLKNRSVSTISANCIYQNVLAYDKNKVLAFYKLHGYNLTFLNRLNVDSGLTVRDLSYFKRFRPAPLSMTDDSIYDAYENATAKKDSLAVLKNSTTLMKLYKEKQIFSTRLEDLLLGSHYVNLSSNEILKFPPIITPSMLEWSNRKGVSLNTRIRLDCNLSHNDYLIANLHLGYCFKKKEFFWKLPVDWGFLPRHNGVFHFEIGNGNRIYNSEQAEDVRKNLSSTQNYDSLLNVFDRYAFNYYNDFYTKFSTSYELVNGLDLNVGVVYHERKLMNWNDFAGKNGIDHKYRSFAPEMSLEWTPGLYYYYNGNRKRELFSRWPTFTAEWERGVRAFNCYNEYERWEFEAKYRLNLYALRALNFWTGWGFYTQKKNMYFVDYTNFRYNSLPDTWVDEMMGQFEALDSRWYNESNYYVKASSSYESPMMIFSRINMFSRYIKRERIYSNILIVHALKPYVETGYSVSTHLCDVGVFTGFANNSKLTFGWKFVFRFLENN